MGALKTIITVAAVGAAAYGIYWYVKNKALVNTGKTSSATGDSRTSECPAGMEPNAAHTKCVKSASMARLRNQPMARMGNTGYSNYTY